jgi:hypothetical protein
MRALIRDDLPTFDLPEKATSGFSLTGNTLVIPHTVSRFALLIIIFLLHDGTLRHLNNI